MRGTCIGLFLLAACSNASSGEAPKKTQEPPRKLAGVYPENFQCVTVATHDAIGGVLGGSARLMDSPSSVPKGIAHPCTYEVTFGSGEAAAPPEYWTFDFDCRDNYKQTADALFAQYTRTSGELVEQYNAASDAAPIPDPTPKKKREPGAVDAAIDAPQRAPEASKLVQVGAKGLDHHGQGLIFIDDDAPCYVRVVGPDAEKRLALAQLVATGLTFANAPMTPRAFK